MALLRIELLGGFRVVVAGDVVPETRWARRRPAAVVKLLALAPGHRLQREQVMELLWPELAPAAAAANLRKAVHHARRALGADAPLLLSAGDLLCLAPTDVWVDVDGFRAAVARARRSGEPEAYVEAVELYAEGLLPEDRYEDWAIERREELEVELVEVLEELAAILEARGDLDGAARAVRRLVAAQPFREQHRARLMRLHALAGRRVEALREYELLRRSLAEVGGEPGPETQRLYEEVRANQASEPDLGAELWERVGDLRVVAGDTRGAVEAFGRALGLTTGESVAQLQRKVASARLMQQDADGAEPHLAAAERLTRHPVERGRLACLRATQAWQRGALDDAERLAWEARTLARRHGDADDVVAAEEALLIVAHLRGNWRDALRLEIERAATGEGERASTLARVSDIHHCIGQYHLYGDGLTVDVEDYARRTLALAEDAGAVRAQAFAWCLLGESLLLRARFDEAAGCLERSCELLGSLARAATGLPWQRLAELAVCRGRLDEVEQPLRRAAAIATVSPMARHLWGRVHATATFAALERGDPEAAVRSVRAAAASAARYGNCATCSALLNPMAAEATAALGDRDGASAYADSARLVAGMFESAAWRAMAESAAGSAATATGDAAEAATRFETAAALYEQAQQPYWATRARAHATLAGER